MSETKLKIRNLALEKRNSIAYCNSKKSIETNIINQILNSKDFIEAKNIALYSPIKNEIDITSITNTKEKTFYLPRCNNLDLEFVEFNKYTEFTISKWGIKEPKGEKINPECLDIIFIPALAANLKCYRLGYGKGYYDRFFENNKTEVKKVIILAKTFITNEFKEDTFDIQCDCIICEQ